MMVWDRSNLMGPEKGSTRRRSNGAWIRIDIIRNPKVELKSIPNFYNVYKSLLYSKLYNMQLRNHSVTNRI